MTATGRAVNLDGNRTYVDPVDGAVLCSVTTAIAAVTSKPYLVPWAAKLAAEFAVDKYDLIGTVLGEAGRDAAVGMIKAEAQRRRELAADRGTFVHDVIEALVTDGPVPAVPDELARDGDEPFDMDAFCDGFLNFVEDHSPAFLMAEATVANPSRGDAGTCDLIAALPRLGVTALIDAKTGKNLDAGMGPQLAAYRTMTEVWLPNGEKAPMPDTQAGYVLHVRPEYQRGYKLFHAENFETDLATYELMVQLYRWQQTAKAKPGRVIYPPLADGSQPPALLEDLDGWTKARNVLIAHGYSTVADVAASSQADLLNIPGFGPASLKASAEMLAAHGLTLREAVA